MGEQLSAADKHSLLPATKKKIPKEKEEKKGEGLKSVFSNTKKK